MILKIKLKDLVPLPLFLGIFSILLLGCQSKTGKKNSTGSTYYTCAMHPQIHEEEPGNCPICGMKLIKIEPDARSGNSLNTSLRYLEEPATQTVIGDFKVFTPADTTAADTLVADGYIGFDERAVNSIASRVAGRIEHLYVKYSNEPIHQGQPLMKLYSPELLSAQRNLLEALKDQDTSIIIPLKENLYHLGMLPSEVREVIKTGHPIVNVTIYSPYEGISQPIGGPKIHAQAGNNNSMGNSLTENKNSGDGGNENSSPNPELLGLEEGMYVSSGQTVFSVQGVHRVWAILNVFSRNLPDILKGDDVLLFASGNPGHLVTGQVNFIPPYRTNLDKTSQIRVYLSHLPENWRVGTFLRGKIIIQGGEKGWYVPLSAVNRLGSSDVVWVQDKDHPNVFHARRVITAGQTGGEIRIISGLEAHDRIAENASYMVDSDSFIR